MATIPLPLKQLSGTANITRHENEVNLAGELAKTWPGISKEALDIANFLAPKLVALNILNSVDEAMFNEVCIIWAELRYLETEINQLPMSQRFVINGRINPLQKIRLILIEQYRKLAYEFGLSPRARVGLIVPNPRNKEVIDVLD